MDVKESQSGPFKLIVPADVEKNQGGSRKKSLDLPLDEERNQRGSRRKSVERLTPMDVDKADEFQDDEYFREFDDDNRRESVLTNVSISPVSRTSMPSKNVPEGYLTKDDFNYTMNLFDKKINAIYKLCKYVSERQNENTKALNKLVVLDELSDDFWNVSSVI